MAQETPPSEDKVYRLMTGNVDAVSAIDEVIAKATKSLCIFDHSLKERGFNSPERFEVLREFMRRDRANEIQIALHETDGLERDCPRLIMLLRQFPSAVKIHRTSGQGQQADDPFVIADRAHFWHKLHFEHSRSVLSLNSPGDAKPLLDRFDEIWECSEPAVSATVAGL
jgi:hypothetical protein